MGASAFLARGSACSDYICLVAVGFSLKQGV